MRNTGIKTLVERLGGRVDLGDATRFATGLRATITLPDKQDRGALR